LFHISSIDSSRLYTSEKLYRNFMAVRMVVFSY
jgi:hypothetical protein